VLGSAVHIRIADCRWTSAKTLRAQSSASSRTDCAISAIEPLRESPGFGVLESERDLTSEQPELLAFVPLIEPFVPLRVSGHVQTVEAYVGY